MKEKVREQQEEQRGVITFPNIIGVMPQFTIVARQHGFRVANNTDKKMSDLSNTKTPLRETNSYVINIIPCKCGKYQNHRRNRQEVQDKKETTPK